MRIGYTLTILFILMVLSGIALWCVVKPDDIKADMVAKVEPFPDLPKAKAKDGVNIFIFGVRGY